MRLIALLIGPRVCILLALISTLLLAGCVTPCSLGLGVMPIMRVTVVDATTGAPVSSATVNAISLNGQTAPEFKQLPGSGIDVLDSGIYVAYPAGGSYNVSVSAPGYKSATQRSPFIEGCTLTEVPLTFALQPAE